MLGTTIRYTGDGAPSTGMTTAEEAFHKERHERRMAAFNNLGLSTTSRDSKEMYISTVVQNYDKIKAALDAADEQFYRENKAFIKKYLPDIATELEL